MKICVSIGHGLGIDRGVVSYLDESVCTREIGNRVSQKLKAQGHSVTIAKIDYPTSINQSLAYRVGIANQGSYDLFIEIHINAGGGTGVECWITGTGGRAEQYAKTISNAIANDLKLPNRGVKDGRMYVTRMTNASAVLIECCFADSKADSNKYNAEKMANAIVQGITGKSTPVEPIREELGNQVFIEDKLPYEINARVHKGSYPLLDADGKEVKGRAVEYWDEILVLEVQPSWKRLEIIYKASIGWLHGYISIDALANIHFKYQDMYLNDGANTNVFLDSKCEDYYGALLPKEKATPLYREDGKLHIVYAKADGSITSGYVNYNGEQSRKFY